MVSKLGGALTIALLGGAGVRAQVSAPFALPSLPDRDAPIAVLDRRHPEYDPVGWRRGSFFILPSVTASGEVDSNVFRVPSDGTADAIVRLQPELRVVSDWPLHALGGYVRGSLNRFASNSSENTTDVEAEINGRIDGSNEDSLSGLANVRRLTEPRQVLTQSLLAASPIRYTTYQATLSAAHVVNRLQFTGRVSAQRYDYDDVDQIGGGRLDQDYRDVSIFEGVAGVAYAVSPATQLFSNVVINHRSYDNLDQLGLSKTSTGFDLQGGVRFRPTPLTRLDVGLGYISQYYDEPLFGTVSGLAASAKATWYPTELTTITGTLARSVKDAAEVGESGYLSTVVDLELDHELLRNLILTARVTAEGDAFKGVDRDDRILHLSAQATYSLNRAMAVRLAVDHESRRSSGAVPGITYDDERFGVTLVLRR